MKDLTLMLDNDFIEALGWTIIHSFWQILLIGFLLGFLNRVFASRSAQWQYRAAVASLVMMIPISLITFMACYTPSISTSTVTFAKGAGGQIFPSAMLDSSSNIEDVRSYIHDYLPIISLLWAVGVVLFISKLLYSLGYVKILKVSSRELMDTKAHQLLQSFSNRFGYDGEIALRTSKYISTPMVFGYLKPVILLPIGMVNFLSTEEVEAILSHEIAHIMRNDYIVNIFISIIESLYYYHPVIWWISSRIKSERENRCDDFALAQGVDRMLYAKTLVKIHEYKSHGSPELALTFIKNKNQLLNRIKRILEMKEIKNDFRGKFAAIGIIAILAIVFSTGFTKKSVHPSDIIVEPWIQELSEEQVIENEVVEIEADNVVNSDIEAAPILEMAITSDVDTMPKKKTKKIVISESNGKNIEIEKEDGKVTRLEIDGKLIPQSDYDKHREIIERYDIEESQLYGDRFAFVIPNDSVWKRSFKWLEKDLEDLENHFDIQIYQDRMGDVQNRLSEIFDDELLEKLSDEELGEDFAEKMEKLQENLELHFDMEDIEFPEGMMFEFDTLFDDIEIRRFEGFPDSEKFRKMIEIDIDEDSDFSFRSGTVVDVLGSELNRDGLLRPYKQNKIELSGKRLKINGEKMPTPLFEKYKRIYEEETGAPLTKKSKMVFEIEGKPSKRKVRTF